MRRRLLIVWLALSLLPLPAGALSSETWESLSTDPRGVTVSFDSPLVTFLNAPDGALDLLNGFLSPLAVQVSASGQDGLIRLSDADSGRSVTVSAGDPHTGIPFFSAAEELRHLFETVLPELFAALAGEEMPETEERNTYFSVLGRSPARQSLTVSKALFSVLPKDTLSPFISGLKTVLSDLEVYPALADYLDHLTLEGELTVRRNLDADGGDMAYQFTGRIGKDGEDVRKLTFIIGKNGDIRYFSIKAPAVRGNGNFQAALTVPKRTENKTRASRKITLSARRTAGEETWKRDDRLELTSQKTGGREISASYGHEITEDGVKTADQLQLKLQPNENGTLEGTLSFSRTWASSSVIRWQAAVRAEPGGAVPAGGAVPMEQAAVLLAQMLDAKISRLPPEDRRQLQHLFRTGAWMNGPSVSPLPESVETEE